MEKVRDFEEESSHYGRTESKPLYKFIQKQTSIIKIFVKFKQIVYVAL